MKYQLLICLTLLSLVFTGCEDGEDVPLAKIEGTYIGTFQRTIGNEPGQTSQVTITFASTSWEGQSDTPHYPALCKGTYELKGSRIKFENFCFFTADFDWSFILKGEYKIQHTGNTVIFTKEVHPEAEPQIIDVYTLQPVNAVN